MTLTKPVLKQLTETLLLESPKSVFDIKSHIESLGYKIRIPTLTRDLSIIATQNNWDWHTNGNVREYFIPTQKEFGCVKPQTTTMKKSTGHLKRITSLDREPFAGDWEVNLKDTDKVLYFDGIHSRDEVRSAYSKIYDCIYEDVRTRRVVKS